MPDISESINNLESQIYSSDRTLENLESDVSTLNNKADTFSNTLTELSNKESSAKDVVVNSMLSVGLSCNTSNTYDELSDKIKSIGNSSTLYSYNIQATYSTSQPNSASRGDIWVPLDISNYELYFYKDLDSAHPVRDSILISCEDFVIQYNFDSSFNNYSDSTTKTLNLNISTNSLIENIPDDYLSVLVSELNLLYTKYSISSVYQYVHSTGTRTSIDAYWYTGLGWKPINYKRNPNLLLYGETNTQNIFAHNKDTGARIWVFRKALNKNMNKYCNCAVGRDLIAIMRNSSSSTEKNYIGFIDKDGTLIRIDEYNFHNKMDTRVQAICYCGYNNSFYSLRNTSSSTVKVFRYDGTSGSFIVNYQFNVTENKTIITCMGDKLFLSNSSVGDVEIVEVDANSLSPIKTHTLPSLREHVVYMNYIYIVNCSKSTNDNTVIEKYEYTNGSFNLIKSTTVLTHSTYNYTRLTMVSNPTNHIPHLVLSCGYTSGGYVILDTDLNIVSTVTNSAINTTYRNSPYAKISAFGDGRLAYNLEDYNTDNLSYIAIFNLFSGNNDIIVNNKSSNYSSILLGTTTGLLNDFPYEY